MGIDCPDVHHVIHWGVPTDAEMYVQESGRAGRDCELSCATILKSAADLNKQYTTQHMINCCTKKSGICRRKILFEDFHGCSFTCTGCKCCDVCRLSCECGQCGHNFFYNNNKHNFTVTAGDPVPVATGAEPDESEGLAELNKGHGPGVTETGCTEEIVLMPLSTGSACITLLLSSPRRLLYLSISLTQDLLI